jgi:hypothetical protein
MCSKNYKSKKPKYFIVWKIARKTAKVSLNVTNLSKKENCINARGWMGVWQKYVVMPSPDGKQKYEHSLRRALRGLAWELQSECWESNVF